MFVGVSLCMFTASNALLMSKATPTVRCGGHRLLNVLRLVVASLFRIFISTCTMINFKLIVSKNENK